ncbi:MAG: hypothetical protein K0S47_2217 [Herbinix sp.]|jgi:hypothetical protein|nr:hypothetical protein [Herbinix sp.]
MKKTTFIFILFLFILIMMTACSKQSDFKDTDENYVFTFDDINNLDKDNYISKTLENGKDYFFTKSNTKLNGFNCLYGIVLYDENENKVKLTTCVDLLPNTEKASQLFKSSIKIVQFLYDSSVKDVNTSEYEVDELLIIESEDYFTIILSKDNLFYKIEIDGLLVHEEQVKENLLKKVNNVFNTNLE